MTVLAVLSLLPDQSNIHGDAANAGVLAARARWHGVDASIQEFRPGDSVPTVEPHVIVLGSGFDSEAARTLQSLQPIAEALHGWTAAGVPLLAVGLGWELLSASVEIDTGAQLEGIGLFRGRAVAAKRATGDILVASAFGELIGYEYHVRDYLLGEGETPLGDVLSGIGNAPGSRTEGALRGSAIGTHLRGPVLARNPALADTLLGRASTRAGLVLGAPTTEVQIVDELTASITARTRRALKLSA